MEENVKELEKKWAEMQENALKQPSPGVYYYYSEFLYLSFWWGSVKSRINKLGWGYLKLGLRF